ncbi:hypothetical protein GYM75_07550 [Gilliamella sp. ESL0441]|nr:hypothetical protein GYM75_07550 [Gilliamella sp. ESL0441]
MHKHLCLLVKKLIIFLDYRTYKSKKNWLR